MGYLVAFYDERKGPGNCCEKLLALLAPNMLFFSGTVVNDSFEQNIAIFNCLEEVGQSRWQQLR